MTRSRGTEESSRRFVALEVGRFALAGVIALVIVGIATAIASRRVGEREAIANARTTTVTKAQGLVAPALTDGVLNGTPAAIGAVDAVVRRDVLDGSLVRVKLWNADGTIVYSDEPRLVGTHYTLGADEKAAFSSGKIEAEVSDLSKPENQYERSQGKLLEVYLPVETPSGKPLLFEAYYRYGLVSSNGQPAVAQFRPDRARCRSSLSSSCRSRSRTRSRGAFASVRRNGSCCCIKRSKLPTWSVGRSRVTSTTAWCRILRVSRTRCRPRHAVRRRESRDPDVIESSASTVRGEHPGVAVARGRHLPARFR